MTTFAAVFMTLSMIAVSSLAGWCFYRILNTPPPREE